MAASRRDEELLLGGAEEEGSPDAAPRAEASRASLDVEPRRRARARGGAAAGAICLLTACAAAAGVPHRPDGGRLAAAARGAVRLDSRDFFDFNTPEIDREKEMKQELTDGNPCQSDEEAWGGLCYKSCRELTGGAYPKRSSPFSCCKPPNNSSGCSYTTGQKISMKVCSGLNVAGDLSGGGCPHSVGKCLDGEEMYLGMCYKKCSELTDGNFPHRVAVATCCKVKSYHCLTGMHVMETKGTYNVGGAKDGVHSRPHLPIPGLVEESR